MAFLETRKSRVRESESERKVFQHLNARMLVNQRCFEMSFKQKCQKRSFKIL